MNKLGSYIVNNFRLYFSHFMMQFLIYVLLPIGFSLFMGWAMAGVSQADSKDIDVDIAIDNQDQGDYGQRLVDSFQTEPLKDYFTIEEDSEISIVVPKDFSKSIDKTPIQMTVKGEPRMTEVEMVKSLLNEWQGSLIKQKRLQSQSQDLSQDQQLAMTEKLQDLAQISAHNQVEQVSTAKQKYLNATETYLISGLIYCLIMGLSSVSAMATKEEFSGLVKRLRMIPLSEAQKTIFDFIADCLIMILNVSMILGLMSFHPDIDGSSLINCLPWLLVFVGFFQATGMFITASFPKIWIQAIIQIIVMLFVFTGFIPMGDLMGGTIKEILSKNWLQVYIMNPLRNSLLGQVTPDAPWIVAGFICIILVFLCLTYIMNQRKERR